MLEPNTALQNNQSLNPFLGSCKRCGSADLEVRQQSIHLGLFCSTCGLWQRWVSKHDARRYHREAQPKLTSTPYPEITERIGPAVDAPNGELAARIERLEKEVAGHDRELGIVLKAIWACGILQGKGGAPDVDVDSDLAGNLGRELAEEEAGR